MKILYIFVYNTQMEQWFYENCSPFYQFTRFMQKGDDTICLATIFQARFLPSGFDRVEDPFHCIREDIMEELRARHTSTATRLPRRIKPCVTPTS